MQPISHLISTRLQPGVWSLDLFVRSLPRSRPRVPVVPEARKKLAGGEAQRNHRKNRTEECCAPAGRASRVTASPRLTTATPPHGAAFRPPGSPVGVRRQGRPNDGGRVVEPSGSGVLSRFSRPAGAQSWVGGGGSGGSAALHHRLISYVPPARRGAGPGAGAEENIQTPGDCSATRINQSALGNHG